VGKKKQSLKYVDHVISTVPEDLKAIFPGYTKFSLLQYCPTSSLPASANRLFLL
jgi:hypothetical protein